MSPAFIKGVEQQLPNAQITFDKFHVMKIINEAVDEVRRQEQRATSRTQTQSIPVAEEPAEPESLSEQPA